MYRLISTLSLRQPSQPPLQESLDSFFHSLCYERPGAVAIRNSYPTFSRLSGLDRAAPLSVVKPGWPAGKPLYPSLPAPVVALTNHTTRGWKNSLNRTDQESLRGTDPQPLNSLPPTPAVTVERGAGGVNNFLNRTDPPPLNNLALSNSLKRTAGTTHGQTVTVKEEEGDRKIEDRNRASPMHGRKLNRWVPPQTNVELPPFIEYLPQASIPPPTLPVLPHTSPPHATERANSASTTPPVADDLHRRTSTHQTSEGRKPIIPLQINNPSVPSTASKRIFPYSSSNVTRPTSYAPYVPRRTSPPVDAFANSDDSADSDDPVHKDYSAHFSPMAMKTPGGTLPATAVSAPDKEGSQARRKPFKWADDIADALELKGSQVRPRFTLMEVY